jgi:radical SAM protein with 4Fe4S-binding SPASM domain
LFPLDTQIVRPPWLASRFYECSDTESEWSVVYNLRARRLLLLEGNSSKVWENLRFDQPLLASVGHVSELLRKPESHVADLLARFADVLAEKGLIIRPGQALTGRDGPTSPAIDQDPLEARIEQRMVAENVLWRLFFEVTYRCNEDCIHCFNPTERRTEELSTEQIARVLSEGRALGALLLCFSGGEVFSRRDAFELLECARDLEYAVDVYTNGVLLSEKRRERLAELYPRSVSVSIYSADAAIHDATTRVKGSLTKSVETLRHLAALGVPINVKCPLMKHTVDGYRAVKDLADMLGATVQFDLVLAGKNDGNLDPIQHRVTDPEKLRMLLMDEDIPLFVGKERIEREANRLSQDGNFCGAGLANLDITPDGIVTPCVSLPLPVGNVKQTSLAEIWEAKKSPLRSWRDVRVQDYVGCGTCERQAHCSKCAGIALVEHGDFLGPSDQDCLISIARVKLAEERGIIPKGSISLVPGKDRLGSSRINEMERRGFRTNLVQLGRTVTRAKVGRRETSLPDWVSN